MAVAKAVVHWCLPLETGQSIKDSDMVMEHGLVSCRHMASVDLASGGFVGRRLTYRAAGLARHLTVCIYRQPAPRATWSYHQ